MNHAALTLNCALLLLTLATPAQAINKCTLPNGKTVFQDLPCQGQGERIEVRPASGMATPRAADPQTAGTAAASPSRPKEGTFGPTWQRRTDLEQHLISNKRAQLDGQLRECDAQQQALSAKKYRANNNLAGATWEQSISSEMQAVATMCNGRVGALRADLEAMEKELRELQARR